MSCPCFQLGRNVHISVNVVQIIEPNKFVNLCWNRLDLVPHCLKHFSIIYREIPEGNIAMPSFSGCLLTIQRVIGTSTIEVFFLVGCSTGKNRRNNPLLCRETKAWIGRIGGGGMDRWWRGSRTFDHGERWWGTRELPIRCTQLRAKDRTLV